jgi:hypothetical protein
MLLRRDCLLARFLKAHDIPFSWVTNHYIVRGNWWINWWFEYPPILNEISRESYHLEPEIAWTYSDVLKKIKSQKKEK